MTTKVPVELVSLDGGIVINESSADVDFRVESNGETHAIFVDGGNDKVGLFTSDTNALLHIGNSNAEGDATNPAFQIGGSTSGNTYRLGMYTDAETAIFENKNGDDGFEFRVKTAGESLRINGGTGQIQATPLGVSNPSFSFIGDTDTGMTRPTGDTIQFICGGTVKNRISSDGLLFNSDTAAANALDDFERGTYTATITCASGSIALYSGYDLLAYTKIGRIVHVQGKLTVNTVSSPTGATTINLPFTINNLNDRAGFCSHMGLGYFNGSAISTGYHGIYMEGTEGTAYIRPYVLKPSSTAGNAPSTNNIGDDHVAQGSDIYINFTFVAS